eukprot:jgi/Psemu1/312746/fgenesh1_kg.1008_\
MAPKVDDVGTAAILEIPSNANPMDGLIHVATPPLSSCFPRTYCCPSLPPRGSWPPGEVPATPAMPAGPTRTRSPSASCLWTSVPPMPRSRSCVRRHRSGWWWGRKKSDGRAASNSCQEQLGDKTVRWHKNH